MLCKICNEACFSHWRALKRPAERHERSIWTPHMTFAALIDSADKGCHLCLFLRTCWLAAAADAAKYAGSSDVDGHAHGSQRDDKYYGVIRFRWKDSGHPERVAERSYDLVEYGRPGTGLPYLLLRFELQDGVMKHLHARPVAKDPDLRLARQWLNNCLAKHTGCARPRKDFLPTRVICVGTRKSSDSYHAPYLMATNGISGCYTALSHCWGNIQPPPTTTKANLRQHSAGLVNLPKTFMDAIKITRKLHMRYIWIASLCIVQDEIDDWQRELTQMADIYENAFLTIACPDAQHADEAILTERVPSSRPACFVQPPASTDAKVKVELVNVGFTHTPYIELGLQQTLLGRRAWVMQERLLAPRILYAGKSGLWFECNTEIRTESRSTPISHDCMQKVTRHKVRKDAAADSRVSGLDSKTWYTVLMEYASCHITRGDDRLPALSGLARRLASKTGDHYCAGLWKSDLIYGIFWESKRGLEVAPTILTPAETILPSWSWASCRSAAEWPNREDFVPLARVADVQITSVACDVFSQVSAGLLTLEAHVRHASMTPDCFRNTLMVDLITDATSGDTAVQCPTGKWRHILAKGRVDDPDAIFDKFAPASMRQVVPVVMLIVHDLPSNMTPRDIHLQAYRYYAGGLILVPDPTNSSRYRRIGAWEVRLNSTYCVADSFYNKCSEFGYREVVDWMKAAPLQAVGIV